MKKSEFIGTSMRDALAKAKRVMGEDALILDSEQTEEGMKITVTTADQAPALAQQKVQTIGITRDIITNSRQKFDISASSPIDVIRTICDICDRHNLGEALCDRWLKEASGDLKNKDVFLDESLEKTLKFSPKWIHSLTPAEPLILVGPQGAGKTSLIAKVAILLSTLKRNYSVVTLDDVKAAGAEQLNIYMRALKQNVGIGYDAFLKAKNDAIKNDQIILVDTPGVNILQKDGMSYFYRLSEKLRDPLTLVMPADMNIDVASEVAQEFSTYNAQNIMATRLDGAKSFGSFLRPAFEQNLTLTLYADSSKIGDSLHPINSENLIELLSK